MMNNANATASASSGMGLSGWLFLVFLVLKLTGYTVVASWSWWWITAPLWIPVLVAFSIITVLVVVTLFRD